MLENTVTEIYALVNQASKIIYNNANDNINYLINNKKA